MNLIEKWVRSTPVFFILILVVLYMKFGAIYSYYYPAVEDFTVDYDKSYFYKDSYKDANGVEVLTDKIAIYGILNKKECKFSSVTASADNQETSVGLDYKDNPSGDKTKNRPKGIQKFGPWFITLQPRNSAEEVYLEAAHTCHEWGQKWTTYTKLGDPLIVSQFKRISSNDN